MKLTVAIIDPQTGDQSNSDALCDAIGSQLGFTRVLDVDTGEPGWIVEMDPDDASSLDRRELDEIETGDPVHRLIDVKMGDIDSRTWMVMFEKAWPAPGHEPPPTGTPEPDPFGDLANRLMKAVGATDCDNDGDSAVIFVPIGARRFVIRIEEMMS